MVPGAGPFNLEPGRLHEAVPVLGSETAGLAFLIGASAPSGLLVWVREGTAAAEHGEAYAAGFAAFGIAPAQVLVVCASKRLEALWAAEEGLKRPSVRVLLELGARGKPLDLTASRRLSLAAEASGASALVLRGDAGRAAPPSSAWTRWQVSSAPSLGAHRDEIGAPVIAARLTRHRGGVRPQDFILEWSGHGFRALESNHEEVGGGLAPAFVDGSDRTPEEHRAVA